MPIQEGGNFTPNNRIVSPGVFTRENDLSGIAQGVADIGAVVVAPFAKGPGFSPTLVTSVADLNQKFGVADGTLYGPYTATQYLQEKGFVTVCRVGALTGYHQNYPWVMWAEAGDWLRATNTGTIVLATSLITTDNFANSSATPAVLLIAQSASLGINTTSSSITYWKTDGTSFPASQSVSSSKGPAAQQTSSFTSSFYGVVSAPHLILSEPAYSSSFGATNVTTSFSRYTYGGTYTGSVNVYNQPVTAYITNSVLYDGVAISGVINGKFTYQGSLLVATASATSASLLSAVISENVLKGPLVTLVGATFTSTQVPFDAVTDPGTLYISQSIGLCALLNLHVSGTLTGEFGRYNGEFLAGSANVFDPCTGEWTTSGSAIKVLTVLADTQYAPIDTTLHAPGFLGSTQTYASDPYVNNSGSTSIGMDFNLALSQSEDGGYGIYEFSLDPNDIKYITNVFGNDPTAGDRATYAAGTKIEAGYVYKIFEDDIETVAASPRNWRIHGTSMPSGSWIGEPLDFTDQWSLNLLNGDSAYGLTNAYTPWIVSQQVAAWNGGSSTRFPLFKFWTLSDGTYTNTSFKIEISNVKLAGTVAGSDWGTFTVTVRKYSDTDKKPSILEQYNNCNLDPTSANFIARKIGDRYNYIRFDGKIIEYGTYDNLSKNIRVEMTQNPYPVTALPYGFQAYAVPVNGAIGNWCNPIAFTKASTYGLFPGRYPSGVDFGGFPSGADAELTALYPTASVGQEHWRDNLQYFAPVPSGATAGSNVTFALDEEVTVNGVGNSSYLGDSNAVPAVYDAANETTYVKMRKFVFGFQGGFDGQSPSIPLNVGADMTSGNTQGLSCVNSTTAGSIAYAQCIGALGNADEFDINLIATPGIIYSLHSYVTNLVIEMCETRGDCFYIMDIYQDDGNPTSGQIDEVVALAGEFDTSYAACYYPWIKIKDTNINQIVTVPPSVVLPGVYAANDRVAGEWFAVAGLGRGGIEQAKQVTDRTTHTERDTLYEGRVNPIAAFPGQGICVWGQKTLQVEASALDRISVRRLLIEIKKFFASSARYLVFEQNTATTRNKFLSIVNPYLESVQQRSGLYAFQVVMDESNNTPDIVDRNILYGQIYLKPTKTSEFIILDFNVMATGATFPTA